MLDKIDAQASPMHRKVINALWREWKRSPKENAIFWDFIERERNNLLKAYAFGASIESRDHGFELVYSTGDDAVGLYREAVYWWRCQLEALEQHLSGEA